MHYHFEDFTEAEYRRLIRLAKAKWTFIDIVDYKQPGSVCLWRHDLDLSVHRAYRIAQIEREEGVKATYFIHLHSEFYNPLEAENVRLLKEIRDMGHQLALHFDPNFYSSMLNQPEDLLSFLELERVTIEKFFRTEVCAFSWHNPDIGNWLELGHDKIGGLINTYGSYFRENYGYCSDSNGYWRYRRLCDVLETAMDKKLQVLTHPGWWVPTAMSPRERISRCINGRAKNQSERYDQLLAENGRMNVW